MISPDVHILTTRDLESRDRENFLKGVERGRFEATSDQRLNLTAEDYVREWDRRGRVTTIPISDWEKQFQAMGLIEEARKRGYISFGSEVTCSIRLEPAGEELLRQSKPVNTQEIARLAACGISDLQGRLDHEGARKAFDILCAIVKMVTCP